MQWRRLGTQLEKGQAHGSAGRLLPWRTVCASEFLGGHVNLDFSLAVINCVFSIFWVHSLKTLTLIYLSMLGALFQYSLRALISPPPPRLPRPCGTGSHRLGNKTKVLVCHTQHWLSYVTLPPLLIWPCPVHFVSFHLPGPSLLC